MVWIYGLGSVILVSGISLIGVLTLWLTQNFIKRIVLLLVSLSAWALLGDAFIHLLPELIRNGDFNITASLIILWGITFGFIMEKILHWRHCHLPTTAAHPHPVAIMNLVGDSVHNLIDWLIIGASYLISIEVGIATTIAVILHEIPQEIGDFGVLVHGWFSSKKALLFNFYTALAAIVWLIIALVLSQHIQWVHGILIPLAIGMFIYIAGSDLIPEMHKETATKQSLLQLVFFLLGIWCMLLVLIIE